MALPTLEPIRDRDLPAFCQFLASQFEAERNPERWAQAFRQDWGVAKPNNGFVLRDQGQIVGCIGAIYAERPIRGRSERFCNIMGWAVLEAYRTHSMRLVMAVVSQPGFHFTDLTPSKVASKMLQFLKFKPMNERQAVWPNIPWPFSWLGGTRVVTDPNRIEGALAATDAKVFRDHRRLPWLRHAAVGRPGAFCHVVWKPSRFKGVPGAMVLGFSDAGLFLRYHQAFGAHLLRQGCFYTSVESRLLPWLPLLSRERTGFENKVFRSDTLAEADVSNLYSEVVALEFISLEKDPDRARTHRRLTPPVILEGPETEQPA
jgi:hypothetical protein